MSSSSPAAPSTVSGPPTARPDAGSAAGVGVLGVGLAALAAGVWIRGAGGVRAGVLGFTVSVRSPWPLVLSGCVLLAGWWWARRRHAQDDVRVLHGGLARRAPLLAILIALAVLIVGATFGSTVAAGADSSGYLSQAALWRRGALVVHEPAILHAGSAEAAWVYSPLGFRPGLAPGTIVPSYPPGLPVQFALAGACGEWAIAGFVGASGAMAVWLAFVLGRRMAGPLAGFSGAALLASSPVFLYQLVQPMSDVPVTAWWLAAFALLTTRLRASTLLLAGAAAGVALATRPNLAPLLAAAFGALAWPVMTEPAGTLPRRAARAGWFLVGLSPAVILLAWFNTILYGAPWASGYGDAGQLFAAGNVVVNVQRYGRWLFDTHLVLLLAAPVGIGLVLSHPDNPQQRAMGSILGAVVVLVGLCYVAYSPFETWTYLRFLLPAIGALCVFAGIAVSRVGHALPSHARLITCTIFLTFVCAHGVGVAREAGAFELAAREQRYELVAKWVRDHTPTNTLVVCVQHSGSIHHTAGRPVLRWDAATPDALRSMPGVNDDAHASGVASLVIVLDADEESAFRARFSETLPLGALDWPPRATTMAPAAARVYVVRDRDSYLRGERIPTTVLAPSR